MPSTLIQAIALAWLHDPEEEKLMEQKALFSSYHYTLVMDAMRLYL